MRDINKCLSSNFCVAGNNSDDLRIDPDNDIDAPYAPIFFLLARTKQADSQADHAKSTATTRTISQSIRVTKNQLRI